MVPLVMLALAGVAFASPAVVDVVDPTVERIPCIGITGYCPGSYATGATCVDGFCECSSENYQRYSCLPVVGSCAIRRGAAAAQAEAYENAAPRETFSCVADDNNQYEVHVLGVYEGIGHISVFQQDPIQAAEMNVYVTSGKVSKPLVLVLSSYEPVNWVLHLPDGVEVHQVLLIAYHVDLSNVTVQSGMVRGELGETRVSLRGSHGVEPPSAGHAERHCQVAHVRSCSQTGAGTWADVCERERCIVVTAHCSTARSSGGCLDVTYTRLQALWPSDDCHQVFAFESSDLGSRVTHKLIEANNLQDKVHVVQGSEEELEAALKDRKGSACSWVGYGGTYSFPVCLESIPTDFDKATVSIFIKHLRSSTILERAFPNSAEVTDIRIHESNVSTVQPGAFRGLPLVQTLSLADNRISSLEPDTFLGLEKVATLYLQKNVISVISQHAFRSLPRLSRLHLTQNRLRSVPVDALLPPKALAIASLVSNHITTIDSQVLRLRQNQKLRLVITGNELNCDGNLTWFICNLPDLDQISARNILECASPADLRGTLLTTMRKDVCQTVTDGSRHGITSITTAPRINTSLYNYTIPTEMPDTSNLPGSEYTTGINDVTIFDTPIIPEDDDSRHVNAIIIAIVTPVLLVWASVVVAYLYNRCRGTGLAVQNAPADKDRSDKIEPYAAVYSNSPGQQASDRVTGRQPTPTQDQTSEDNDDIEPYAVSYMDVSGKGKNGKLAPYATTSFAHIKASDLEDNDDIEPYAVSYMDVSGKRKNGKLAPYATTSFAHIKASDLEDNDDIEPYAVSYMDVSGKGKKGKLAPYATTTINEDQGPQLQAHSMTSDEDPGPQLQPCAVTHDEDPGPQLQPCAVTQDEDPGPQLQPYAVTQDEDPGPQLQPYAVTHDEDPGPQLQPYAVTQDEDTWPQLQPYAVTHDEDPGPQLQPYAVTHDEDPGPQLQPYAVTNDEDPGPQLQPYSVTYEDPGPQLQPYSVTHDEDPGPQLQPYAVTHDEDPGPQLQPYAVTHDEDPGPQLQPYAVTHNEDPGPQLQPYAVTHDEDPGPQLQSYTKTFPDNPEQGVVHSTPVQRSCTTQLMDSLRVRTAHLTCSATQLMDSLRVRTTHLKCCTTQLMVSLRVRTAHITCCTAQLMDSLRVRTVTAYLYEQLMVSLRVRTAHITCCTAQLMDSLRVRTVTAYLYEQLMDSLRVRTAHLTCCTKQLADSPKVRTAHLTCCTKQLVDCLRVSMVIAEPYYTSSLLPWHSLYFWYVCTRLRPKLQEGAVVLPAQASLVAVAMEFENLWRLRAPVGTVEGFDISVMDQMVKDHSNQTDERVEPHPLWEYPGVGVSDPVTLLNFDLTQPVPAENMVASGEIPFTCSGSCNAVALWMNYDLLGDGRHTVSTGPRSPYTGGSPQWDPHIRQGVYFMEEPVQVTSDSRLVYRVTFSPKDGQMDFSFDVKDSQEKN
ncbi:PRMT7 [Branchiostoma lanceolatum]|uniref:PRMT7 protein n=1 Tax=Branchiostoma lanceolatum TaxID=7740 RepID=A0A8K0A2L9_BRALA|nr:PRMT7 [Branchiostoma lanceolatum]